MTTITAVNGNEIIEIVAANQNGIRLGQLFKKASERFGPAATFHACSHFGLNLDDLLVFLEARNKLRIVNGVIHAGDLMARPQ